MTLANQVLQECESTNDIAKRLAEAGCPHGTWVSTRIQTLGRGRLGRKWQSIEGNLFLSIVVQITQPQTMSWIPLTTGYAVCRFLRKTFPTLEVQVKWPNDIYLQNAKLGGILCEGSNGYIVIGLGLNCVDSPEGIDQSTTSLTHSIGGKIISADDIRDGIRLEILSTIEMLQNNGLSNIRHAYEDLSVFQVGEAVEWGDGQNGIIKGLGSSGELEVILSDGTIRKLFAEDVKLRRYSLSSL